MVDDMALSGAPTSAPHTTTLQDVSGTLSVAVETILILVNILPIVVVLKVKEFKDRVVTDELILALSITDILSVLVPTPLGLISYFNQSWYGGRETCVFYQVTLLWFKIVSILIVTFMCIDRFMAVRMALYYKIGGLYSVDKVKYFVLVLYGFSLTIVSLPLMGLAPPVMSGSSKLCESWVTSMPHTSKESIFYITLLSVGYLNMLVVAVVNIGATSMLWKLKQKMLPKADRTLSNITELRLDRKAIFEFTWMVIAVSVVFYLTWFPTMVMMMLQKIGIRISDVAILYALLSTTLTGLLNPLLYGLFSRSYRRSYRQILSNLFRCLCRCRSKGFEPVPAIAGETNMENDVFVDPTTMDSATSQTRNYMRKSKSFHDKPLRGGFYNHALDTSVHSALCGVEEGHRFRRRHSDIRRQKRCRRRARSLTPPRVRNCYVTDQLGRSHYQDIHSSSSTLASSIASNNDDVSSDDMEDEDDDDIVGGVSRDTSATLETAI